MLCHRTRPTSNHLSAEAAIRGSWMTQQEQVTGSLTGYKGGQKVFGDVVLQTKCEGLVGIRQKLAVLKNTKSTSPGKGEPIFLSLLPSKIQGIGET